MALLRNLQAFAARPSAFGQGRTAPVHSPLRALIALALHAKGFLPPTGGAASGPFKTAGTFPAARPGSRRNRATSDSDNEGRNLEEGRALLDALDGLVADLLGPFDGSGSREKGDERHNFKEKERQESSNPSAESADTQNTGGLSEYALSPVSATSALDAFNRSVLPDGKRWLILPFESVDTGEALAAVFRVLVDRPGPDGRESVLSLAAELRANGKLWSLRLPRGLSSGAPLLIACDDPTFLSQPPCRAAALLLADKLGLDLVLQDLEAGTWPAEWEDKQGATDVLA